MENLQIPRATASYITRLNRTLNLLQERVKEQEAALEQLRAANSSDNISHLQQIRSLTTTYESLVAQDPYLPSSDSPLPALLALRSTWDCIYETEDSIKKTEIDLKKAQKRIEDERADFSNAEHVQNGLETRILSLQEEIEERSQRTPSQTAKDLTREMKTKKNHYDRETGKLVKAFNGFIDEHLAPMLAAEELGGPIVGESLDIDEDILENGFNFQGRAKRSKNGVGEDKRQRRIDEIWGPRPPENSKAKEPWNERLAAATEMRELTEQLLNSLVEAERGGPGAYVELERESAAARFLVRSKVAHFHPKDARRLRLVDFGSEIED